MISDKLLSELNMSLCAFLWHILQCVVLKHVSQVFKLCLDVYMV